MASLMCTLTVDLFEPTRALPDSSGGKGYNVYRATYPLNGSELPINIAHWTLQPRYPNGTRARVTANSNFLHTALLMVTTRLIPAPMLPILGSELCLTFPMPCFFITGVVASAYKVVSAANDSIMFDVTIARKDVFPLQELTLKCWTNRDWKRLKLTEYPAVGKNVIISGGLSGWSTDNTPLVDVHTLDYNHDGDLSPIRITDAQNPFDRAVWVNGFALFAAWLGPPPTSYGYNLISTSAPPTLVTRQASPTADPRLAPGRAAVASTSGAREVHEPVERPQEAMDVDSVPPAANASAPAASPGPSASTASLASLVSGWMPGDSAPPTAMHGAAPGPAESRDEVAANALLGLRSTVQATPVEASASADAFTGSRPACASSSLAEAAGSQAAGNTGTVSVPARRDIIVHVVRGTHEGAAVVPGQEQPQDSTADADAGRQEPFVSVQDVRDAFEHGVAAVATAATSKRSNDAVATRASKIRKMSSV